MKKPSHSNSGRRRSFQQRNPQQNRNTKPGGGGQAGRPRGQNGGKNRQATELWLKSTSETMTAHIPMVSKTGERDNGQQRRNDSRSGQGNGRQRQGRPSNNRNGSGERNFRSKPFNPSGNANGNGGNTAPARSAAPTRSTAPAKATALPEVDVDVPRPDGLTQLTAGIEPFELFCAYHLGITPDRGYRPSNINEVANRFRVDPPTIKQALKDYDMDPAALLDRDFDMALGQLDIQVAPEGVDRKELAKNIYREFLEAETVKRDWGKILEEDRKENQKVFKD